MSKTAKMKKPWYKKAWVWIIVALVLIIGLAGGEDAPEVEDTIPAASAVESTNPTRVETNVVESAVTSFGLDESCIDIILTYVPNSADIVDITQDAAANYHIHMKDGTVYLMPIFIGGDNVGCVARISTNESDADNRTIFYDFNGKTSPSEPETPELTMGQKNAVRKAESYLELLAFSRSGLIEQLEYEGFSTEDATFAVDYIEVDWNEQAALKAKSYLDLMAFSADGLVEQLEYEGFTDGQITYALKAVGY
jgi:hypothetical protein